MPSWRAVGQLSVYPQCRLEAAHIHNSNDVIKVLKIIKLHYIIFRHATSTQMIKILLQIYSKPISLATIKVIILYIEKYNQ
jgi:hypothetical protein